MKDKIQLYMNYIVIAIVSLLALIFFPMLGSSAGLAVELPDTPVGWTVWIVIKVMAAIINLLIFNCFMQQGKINSKNSDNYKKACEILNEHQDKEAQKPLSPSKWIAKQWGTKGVTIFLGSIVSAFAISQAVLTYDYNALLSYAITIVFGVVFGIVQMAKAEAYWTEDFLIYALSVKALQELETSLKKHEEVIENDNSDR